MKVSKLERALKPNKTANNQNVSKQEKSNYGF